MIVGYMNVIMVGVEYENWLYVEDIAMNYTADIMEQDVDMNQMEEALEDLERKVRGIMDISDDISRVVAMTPKDGYQKKLELISEAEDMSTKEKIAAIDVAEDKFAKNLSDNAEMCKNMMWFKIGLVLTCTAGIVFMGSTPEGRKMAKSVLKMVA